MTIIVNCEQGEAEWLKLRCGLLTASNFKKIITVKGTKSSSWQDYMFKLASEQITGGIHEEFYGADMELGNEMEGEARDTYSFIKEVSVKEVGFIYKDKKKLFGYSPDGLVGKDGLIEIKHCKPKIQLRRIAKPVGFVSEHWQQVQGGLYVSGRKWCDLISYSRFLKMQVIRIFPDKEWHEKLDKIIKDFLKALDKTVTAYKDHTENENTVRIFKDDKVELQGGASEGPNS